MKKLTYLLLSLFFITGCNADTDSNHCGDNVVDVGEECDSQNLTNRTCQDLGYASGALACTDTCTFDVSQCDGEVVPVCGDDIIQEGEECDGTSLNNETCMTKGFVSGTLSCSSSCVFDESQCQGNVAPVITNLPATEQGSEGNDDSFQVTATDENNEHILSFDIDSTTCSFEVSISNAGLVTWTCGDTETCVVTVGVADDGSPMLTDTGILTIECANAAPELTSTAVTTASEMEPYTYAVTCTDHEGDTLTLAVGNGDTCGGSITDTGNGTGDYAFTPNETTGGSSCNIHIECSDSEFTVDDSSSLSILDINSDPVLDNLPATVNNHWGTANNYTISVTDTDIPADTFTWAITNNSCSFTPTVSTDGTVDWVCIGFETCTVDVTVSDSGAPVKSDTGTLTIACDNTAPVIISTPSTAATAFKWFTYDVACMDPDSDAVALSIGPNDTCDATLVDNGNGTAQYQFIPEYGSGGTTCDMEIQCSDNQQDDIELTAISIAINAMGITSISSGTSFSCAIVSGQLFCWGINDLGQLGDGTVTRRNTPTLISAFTDWEMVSSLYDHSCALRSGTIYCWGRNEDGQLGTGSPSPFENTPQEITGFTDWYMVNAGISTTCALRNEGERYCWGADAYGIFGNGTDPGSYSPVQVGSINHWSVITLGYHQCGLRNGGELWCWGRNYSGELGINSTTNQSTPVRVGAHDDWDHIVAGQFSTWGIRNGELYAWGDNASGQLGDGTATGKLVPTRIGTDSNWDIVMAARKTACATKAGGELWCWGYGYYGQIGDGTGDSSQDPVRVGTDTDWKLPVPCGYNHVCGTKGAGAIYCWGWGAGGQMGDGTYDNNYSPGLVTFP